MKEKSVEDILVRHENVESRLLVIRGRKVLIDRDIAELYGVETKYLNRQVKRNINRFPPEFMFQLTKDERDELVTNWHRFNSIKHSSFMPHVFTEHGVAMLASVLNSNTAVEVSIHIIKDIIHIIKKLLGKPTEKKPKIGFHS